MNTENLNRKGHGNPHEHHHHPHTKQGGKTPARPTARLWKKLLPCSDDSGKHRGKRLLDIADAEQWRQSERNFHISDLVNERQFTIKGKGKTLVCALDKLSRQLCQSEPDAIIRRDCVGARQRSVSTSCHWQGRHYSERIREDDDHPTTPKWLAAPPQRERGHCVVSKGIL